jgi:hypothetical protein
MGVDTLYRSKIESMSSNFKNTFINKLKAKFTDEPCSNMIIMEVDGNIRQSALSGQFFTRMTITVRLIDTINNEELFSKTTPEIKGGSVTDIKSLQNAVDEYLKSYNDKMVEKIYNFIEN